MGGEEATGAVQQTSGNDALRYWPVPCLLLLVVYTLYPARNDIGYLITHPLAETVEALTYLFSFPLGPVSAYNLRTYDGGPGQRLLLWAVALCAGCFQWFVLVPALLALRRPAVTTLNLMPADTVARATPAHAAAPAAAPAPPRLAARPAPPVPLYDERGRTPLERAMMNDERKGAGCEVPGVG